MISAWTDTALRGAVAGVRLLVGALVAGSALAQLYWEQRSQFPGYGAPVAYDSGRARLVVHAGTGLLALVPETWEWDGVAWQLRSPAQLPPSRSGHALAYDSLRGRTVLFGGSLSSYPYGDMGDTWLWDGTTWSAGQLLSGPPARSYSAMAFDAVRGRVVMFGGQWRSTTNQGYFADTWEWDGVGWLQRASTTSPPGRAVHGMAYDVIRRRVVMYGGQGFFGAQFHDTWEWDGVNWAQRVSPQQPSGTWDSALAYDVARGRTVLFVGHVASGTSSETWEWDGANWTRAFPLAAPPPGSGGSLAYDWARGGVLMVGRDATGSLAETWRWNGTQWTRLYGEPVPPPFGTGVSLRGGVWDRARSALLVVGSTATGTAEFWQWDGRHWLDQHSWWQPSSGGAMANDTSRAIDVLFNGLGETWEWNGQSWRRAATSGPSPRACEVAFDQIRGQTVLFGGRGSGTQLADTWLWDGAAWRQSPASGPPAREGHAMAFDERRGVVVLFGGIGSASSLLRDTWEWDGSSWVQRTPAHAPASHGPMTWDAARARLVFAGRTASGIEIWDWDGTDWELRSTAPGPAPRSDFVFAYDRARERSVLFGGFASGTFSDLWELGPVQPARVTPFGSGCAGILGAPLLDVVEDARPWLGDAITLRLAPLGGGAVAVFALGSSISQWSGAPLPAPLDGLGMPGCTLFVGVDESRASAEIGGAARLSVTVPTSATLLGMSFYLQAAASDPGANSAGIVVSNALTAVVGAR